MIPEIIGATGRVSKVLTKNQEAIPGERSTASLQRTVVQGTSHITQKVLQSETGSLSCGSHRRFKSRSTGKKMTVTRVDDDDDDDDDDEHGHVCRFPKYLVASSVSVINIVLV
jgi:hypothetical protein